MSGSWAVEEEARKACGCSKCLAGIERGQICWAHSHAHGMRAALEKAAEVAHELALKRRCDHLAAAVVAIRALKEGT